MRTLNCTYGLKKEEKTILNKNNYVSHGARLGFRLRLQTTGL